MALPGGGRCQFRPGQGDQIKCESQKYQNDDAGQDGAQVKSLAVESKESGRCDRQQVHVHRALDIRCRHIRQAGGSDGYRQRMRHDDGRRTQPATPGQQNQCHAGNDREEVDGKQESRPCQKVMAPPDGADEDCNEAAEMDEMPDAAVIKIESVQNRLFRIRHKLKPCLHQLKQALGERVCREIPSGCKR